jgi:hypothetical protein
MHTRGAVLLGQAGTLSQDHERVAQLLKDYNPELELQYIPENERSAFDAKPFRVVHNSPKFGVYVIGNFAVDEVNEKLVSFVFKHDAKNRDVLSDLEAEEAAREALRLRKILDEHEERQDFGKSLIQSPLHTYRHAGKKYT